MAGEPPLAVRRYPRDFFLSQVWDPRRGEHVTLLGPTGSGKTHLAHQLLEATINPEYPAILMVMKEEDDTVEAFAERVALKRVTSWPQPPSPFNVKKPNGYTVWPRLTYNTQVDEDAQYRIFKRTIEHSHRAGNRILFADETVGLEELGLHPELRAVWRRGRSKRVSLWAASQTPTHISSLAYNQASHIFLGRITEKRARERFGEISGVHEKLVRETVLQLRKHEWLYVRQEDSTMCIVEA